METDRTGSDGVPDQNGELILVVEDDKNTATIERFVLEQEGYTVINSGSGEEALEVLEGASPVLVLLDIYLPGMDGFTVCQKIRESSQVPIIMVTGAGRDRDKVRGLEMGAQDYITKPFSVYELSGRVKAVLRRVNNGPARPSAIRPLANQPNTSFFEDMPNKIGSDSPAQVTTQAETLKPPEPAFEADSEFGEHLAITPSRRFKSRTNQPPVDDSVITAAAAQAKPDEPAAPELYQGLVRLAVETAGEIRNLADFVDTLWEYPQLHLLRTVSNPSGDGMDVWLRLQEPNPLRSILLGASGVSSVEPVERSGADPDTAVLRVSLD
ncbi:MAG: response regulator [Chloroflexi bacterium]|nr:response regulator [Chloroflexota bacterium]MDA1271454.1 response regulator [Chloroflexota bacterium]PKB58995.1 MAG: hypothetical protein BZY83_04395 [SAR202 cluster bacterium Casp-Chloro-G2]